MVELSDSAISEFKKVLEVEENKGLSIKIRASMSESSCCSCGPSQSYDMGLVEKGDEGDKLMEFGGVNIYMDEGSLELMSTSLVDFAEEYGFIVKDLNAPSCGCGDESCGDEGGHGGHGSSCCG